MMLTHLTSRHRRRYGVSTIIGGLIVLFLLLTALGTMVFVSQQYDQYQQSVKKMNQYDSQRFSERLIVNSPGLAILTSPIVPGWGSGCQTTYNCYNISISNEGGVSVQIARIYINSTGLAGSGCSPPNPQPCILNPTSSISAYTFNLANQFLNPGEVNHAVVLALPFAVSLPNPTPAFPQNSILLATTRGNVFSFQWPLQLQIYGQSQSAFSSGIMKIAYLTNSTGYDSIHDYVNASGHTSGTYCHGEPLQIYPAASNYAEKLTGISGVKSSSYSNTLYFVNPWVTNTIIQSVVSGTTLMFIYVTVINTGQSPYSVGSGSIDLTWYGQNHLDGTLFGFYYKGTFYAAGSLQTIAAGTSYYAIYRLQTATMKLSLWPPSSYGSPAFPSKYEVMFWGTASITNGAGKQSEDQTYFSGTILLSGLWIRSGCS